MKRIFALFSLLAWCCAAFAGLTTAQYQTLKTYILADQTLASQPMTSGGASVIASALNVTASPNYWVWRTEVSRSDIYNLTDPDGGTWNWTTYKNQGATEQNAWTQMFMGDRADFSKANLRSGVSAIFTGSAQATAQVAHVLAIARRKATLVEKVLASGTGSTASPATMGFEGRITSEDIQVARELP